MLSHRQLRAALAACVVTAALFGFANHARAQEAQIGNPCSGTNNSADWDTIAQCISGTFARAPYALGSAAAAAGSSCVGYVAGTIRYNTTLSNLEFCNGTTWTQVPAYSTSCGTPSGLSFTNVSNATLNTVYTSNAATITFSGCSSALSVSVSGASTAQISVNGSAWSTSGAISSGQTLQVRLTSSGSASTGLTATVTVGSSSTNWTVTTRSASLQVFMTPNTYNGNLGDLAGADAVCQTAANTAGYSGTYKAIMSDSTTSAASRLTLSYPVVNAYDGSTVASTNLWGGSISNMIDTPSGGNAGHGSMRNAWTGTNQDGSINSSNCTNWSVGNSSVSGEVGSTGLPSSGAWVAGGTVTCDGNTYLNVALYCIQQ